MATVQQLHPTFHLWAEFEPIEKGGDEGQQESGLIRGIASSESVDADGEIVDQHGIDWSLCKAIHLNHPVGALTLIGEVLEIEPPTMINGVKSTVIKGRLFLEDRVARAVWDKAKVLQKAKAGYRLGFSIEGRARQRNPENLRHITKSMVSSLAVAGAPKNRDSVFEPIAAAMRHLGHMLAWNPDMDPDVLMRGATIGYPQQGIAQSGGLGVAVPQSIEGGVSSASYYKLDEGYLKDLTNDDLMTMRVLKAMPQLSWSQGAAVVGTLKPSPTKAGAKA